jgi:hypothetical protein
VFNTAANKSSNQSPLARLGGHSRSSTRDSAKKCPSSHCICPQWHYTPRLTSCAAINLAPTFSRADNYCITHSRDWQCPRASHPLWATCIPRPQGQGPVDTTDTTQCPITSKCQSQSFTTRPRRRRLITHHTHDPPAASPPPDPTRTLHNLAHPRTALPSHKRRHSSPALPNATCAAWRRPPLESRNTHWKSRLHFESA